MVADKAVVIVDSAEANFVESFEARAADMVVDTELAVGIGFEAWIVVVDKAADIVEVEVIHWLD